VSFDKTKSQKEQIEILKLLLHTCIFNQTKDTFPYYSTEFLALEEVMGLDCIFPRPRANIPLKAYNSQPSNAASR
jgi:hypothetical protein